MGGIVELSDKINKKTLVAGVVGMGYVGLPLMVEIAKNDIKVIGFNRGQEKVDKINKGENYIQDVNDKELAELVSKKLLSATTDFKRVPEADVICIAVPTPINGKKEPELDLVIDATEKIGKNLRKGQLVILKSTTYPGTTEEVVLPILEKESGLRAGSDFYLAFAPERIDPGNEKYGTGNTPKVVGGVDKKSGRLAADFFRLFITEVFETKGAKEAEMTKILENTFRLINISFINEMAIIAKKLDIDIWEVIEAAKTKPFGFMPFYPGPGLGGHCIPVDPYYLSYKAKKLGLATDFIDTSSKIDDYMHEYVVRLTEDALKEAGKNLKGSRLLVIGVAYKKDINDLRESPALKVMELLTNSGAHIDYYDPHVPNFSVGESKKVSLKTLTKDKIASYDAVLILTDHSQVNYDLIAGAAKVIIDTRHAISKDGENIYRI
ncbi:MAG: nucleotide sugar dehydrogenase [Patescibacteria group bacterium]|nr:nucleotide sugar dehydrogenase [Patescibacteria group bacterium]